MSLSEKTYYREIASSIFKTSTPDIKKFLKEDLILPLSEIENLIIGTGVGIKDDKFVIKIFAQEPEYLNLKGLANNFETSIENFVIDKIGKVKPYTHVGASCSHHNIGAGTLGCFVEDTSKNEKYLLSNYHVLVDNNNGIGDLILSPSPNDNGQIPTNVIAKLHSFCPIDYSNPNIMDAAIAELLDNSYSYNNYHQPIGLIKHHTDAILNQDVKKVGRTTGLTNGKVDTIDVSIKVWYNGKPADFEDQIKIIGNNNKVFSQGGDSGSLIINDNNEAVGLLFAGDMYGNTFACPIDPILNYFKVSLI
jgi:hypothetical protein